MSIAILFLFCGFSLSSLQSKNVLASNIKTIDFSVIKGERLSLTCSDIEYRSGLPTGSLKGLTITKLPPEGKGILLVSDQQVEQYQELDRQQIDNLVFIAANSTSKSEIIFIPKTDDCVTTTLYVNVLDKPKLPPNVQSSTVQTSQNTPIQGKVEANDPENDLVKINVITKPQKGSVTFNGIYFKYEPYPDQVGEDKFTFMCIDTAGNYSREATVQIKIEQSKFYYADMTNNPSHYSTIKLQESGIMIGEKIGKNYYFKPSSPVTQKEFLPMIISAAGLEGDLAPCVNTGLATDSKISLWLKPYVKLALDKGIITDKNFNQDDAVTRASAVVMIDTITGMEHIKRGNINLADRGSIPNWANQAYIDLLSYRMLDLYDGHAHPLDVVTRDHAADLIWQLKKYSDMNHRER